jgi:hypothetical protein
MLDIRPVRPAAKGSTFLAFPATSTGRWAGGLAIACAALVAIWLGVSKVHAEPAMAVSLSALRLAPLCGGAAALLSLLALVTQRERSWFVWLGLVPGALMLVVAALELLWIE